MGAVLMVFLKEERMTTLLKQNGRVTNPVDMTAYKVVRSDRTSDVDSASRPALPGYEHNRGRRLTYNRYETVYSPDGPGIMAYLGYDDARRAAGSKSGRLVLTVVVPAGTPYWEGTFNGHRCITADTVRVLD